VNCTKKTSSILEAAHDTAGVRTRPIKKIRETTRVSQAVIERLMDTIHSTI
jgi:DNA-binding transcriptional regulator YiaG